jgi:hypothetical protein
MKVRFDNMTSDSAISDADTGAKDGKVLPVADWDAGSSSRPGMIRMNASDFRGDIFPECTAVEDFWHVFQIPRGFSSSTAPGSGNAAFAGDARDDDLYM